MAISNWRGRMSLKSAKKDIGMIFHLQTLKKDCDVIIHT